MSENKITRNLTHGLLGGVCAGLGSYFKISPVFLRILFILLIFAGGIGIFAYLFLWLLLPAETDQDELPWDKQLSRNADEFGERMRQLGLEFSRGFRGSQSQLPTYIGGALVFLGGIFLIQTLNLRWLSWLRLEVIWALMLIAAGIFLLYRRSSKG